MKRLNKIVVVSLLSLFMTCLPVFAAVSPPNEAFPDDQGTYNNDVETKELKAGDCKDSGKQLICEIENKNYFYTITGSYTPVYKGVLIYSGDLMALSTEELKTMLQLKIYDHETEQLIPYDNELLIEFVGDNKYTIEVELLNGTRLKLPITVNNNEFPINETIVFSNVENHFISNKNFFFLSLASIMGLTFVFKIILDRSLD